MNNIVWKTTFHQRATWRMLIVLDWKIRTWGHSGHHGSLLYVIYSCKLIFNSQAWIEIFQKHWHQILTWRRLMASEWILWGWGCSWHYGSQLYIFFEICANFQPSSINKNVYRTTCSGSRTWKILMVPAWIIKNVVILDIMDHIIRNSWVVCSFFNSL